MLSRALFHMESSRPATSLLPIIVEGALDPLNEGLCDPPVGLQKVKKAALDSMKEVPGI